MYTTPHYISADEALSCIKSGDRVFCMEVHAHPLIY